MAELRDYDRCACGDYRKDHVDGHRACKFNQPKDLTHGFKDCNEFRLSLAATEVPTFYRELAEREAQAS